MQHFGVERGNYALLTLHRAANVDDRDCFAGILEGLSELAQSYRIIFPAHPRTQKQIREHGFAAHFDRSHAMGIEMVAPQGYLNFICPMKHARLVVTDSGDIQEETTTLGVPCVTVREKTERPVTVEVETNVLAGTSRASIREAIHRQPSFAGARQIPEKWDGMASARIVKILAHKLMPEAPVVCVLETAGAPLQQNA